jgi:phosphopantetheine adenylyltransferase
MIDVLIEEAKKRIKYLEDYIKKIENYKPTTMEEEAVYLYVQLESVTKVARELNEKDYRVGNRKLNTVDISDIIRSKPKDEIHEMAKKMFIRNKKRAAGTGWI